MSQIESLLFVTISSSLMKNMAYFDFCNKQIQYQERTNNEIVRKTKFSTNCLNVGVVDTTRHKGATKYIM